MKINRKPAFQPISGYFYQQRNTVVYDTEKRLVKLLIEKSEKGIETVKTDITREMNKKFPDYTDSERYQLSDIGYQFARNKKDSDKTWKLEEIKRGKIFKKRNKHRRK